MKTQYYTASSLDGFIATEEDSLDWLFQLGEPDKSGYPEFIAEIGALAMGAATYEWLLKNLQRNASGNAPAWPYKQPAWVFSKRKLPSIEGADIRFVSGNVSDVHIKMEKAAGNGNIWIMGGGDLAGQFYDAGLLDEIIVQIGSVTLGGGKPLFPRTVLSPNLRLQEVRRIGAEMVELRYKVLPGEDK